MSHDSHTESTHNKDLFIPITPSHSALATREEAREYYLSLLEDYDCPYPVPVVTVHDGVRVVRDDLIVGTKARAADPFVAMSNHERFVYCQPRTGLAGVSVLDVANRRDRDVTLFMPACKRVSVHQACCIERGAHVVFERIAAMPNLNKYAREWADHHDHSFIPLGLDHPLATAGIVLAAQAIPEPEEVYVALSTGVLHRALQIAWPNARFTSVAVARNIKAGERGESEVLSDPLPFQTPEREANLPPFPTVPTYDGKVWKYVPKNSGRDVLMWNVGTDPVLNDHGIIDRTESDVPWRKDMK